MEAVVMAAGEGLRMRPLTDRWAKAVLPVDGRPVVATLARELAASGLARATVVVGHHGGQIEALLGDGSPFGLELRYARQPEPAGAADAVVRALAAGARPPLLAVAADTVFRPGDLGAAAARWLAAGAPGGLGVREARAAELPERYPVRVEDGRVAALVPRPEADAAHPLVAAPLWLLDAELSASLAALPGPPFELVDAFQRALDAGSDVVALELGPTRDLTRPQDVIVRNFPYLSGW